MKSHIASIITATMVLIMAFHFAGAQACGEETLNVTEVSGTVKDASGNPLQNAVVTAEGTDVSPVLTNSQGRYKFYLVGHQVRFTLRVSKDGYATEISTAMTPEKMVKYDTVLKQANGASIILIKFVSGASISGEVRGLSGEETGKHKVLVYVLTDKWYIHPYAENKERRGFAKINSDGSWEIQTVDRGHSPFKLAMLVVPKDTIPPAAIDLVGDAEPALKAKFGREIKALVIINAPEGL